MSRSLKLQLIDTKGRFYNAFSSLHSAESLSTLSCSQIATQFHSVSQRKTLLYSTERTLEFDVTKIQRHQWGSSPVFMRALILLSASSTCALASKQMCSRLLQQNDS